MSKILKFLAALCLLFLVISAANAKQGEDVNIKITMAGKVLTAKFEDNPTSRALIDKMPFVVKMIDLYERELCYHFGAGALSVGQTRSDGYEVGELAYWPPRGSFVILYKQNGEKFERVRIGMVAEDVGFMDDVGDIEVKFELAK